MSPCSQIRDLLDLAVAQGARLLECESGRALDATALRNQVCRAAAGLTAMGLQAGDRLALLLPHTLDWYVLHFAAAHLGVLTIPINTRYSEFEIVSLLKSTRAKAVAVDPFFLGLDLSGIAQNARREIQGLDFVITVSPDPKATSPVVELSVLLDQTPRSEGHQDWSLSDLIAFGTSGTTSTPKLAVHDQRGVVRHAQEVARTLGIGPNDSVLCLLPPSGAYGYTVALAAMAGGASLALTKQFSPAHLGALVRDHQGTFMAVTEPILRAALKVAGAEEALSGMRLIATAGGSVIDIVMKLDGLVPVINVYGASETLALVAVRSPADSATGRAMPGGTTVSEELIARVVDPSTGSEVPRGDEGELQFRGFSVFQRYLENPSATSEAFTEANWYRSGDRARLQSERTFHYLSRMADTMRLHGYLVDPAQIEEALIHHPEVDDAQVVGIWDESTGEDMAVAFVVPRTKVAPTSEGLHKWCRSRLAAYKVPAYFFAIDAIPTTPSANGEKALKRSLRDRAHQLLQKDVSSRS